MRVRRSDLPYLQDERFLGEFVAAVSNLAPFVVAYAAEHPLLGPDAVRELSNVFYPAFRCVCIFHAAAAPLYPRCVFTGVDTQADRVAKALRPCFWSVEAFYGHLIDACEGTQRVIGRVEDFPHSGVEFFLQGYNRMVSVGATGDPLLPRQWRHLEEDVPALHPCLEDPVYAAILVCAVNQSCARPAS